MDTRRKNVVRTERPKIRRVYVSLINPDNREEREHFTAYETDVQDIKRRLVGPRKSETATA